MASRFHILSVEDGRVHSPFGRGLRTAFRLLNSRRSMGFLWLIAQRVSVGLLDLLLAAALYLLFLRLQGASPLRRLAWTPKTILSNAAVTSALILIRALLDTISTWSASRQIQSLYKDFLLRLSGGYHEMRWERFVERNRSELLNHAVYTAREAADFYHRCVELTASMVVVVCMIAALVYQSPLAAAGLGTAALLIYAVHQLFIRKRLHVAAFNRERSLRTLHKHLADMFSSGKEIRTYRNQTFFFDRIREQANCLGISNQRVLLLPQIARILADQGVVLVFLCIVMVSQMQHGDTRQLLSLLVFYFALSRRLLPLMSQISFVAGQMESAYENVKIVDSELNDCLLHRDPTLPAQLPDPEFVLELHQVSFSFHESLPVLRNVNLRLRKAEIMVLRGTSGGGKSSLLNLIAGISQPGTGVVRVDRKRIAYVTQETPLLDDTIRSNLLFGLPDMGDAELTRALSVARLEEFVAAQPFGLETRIGDNGILFSGGERQRLGLARAILRGATLLLLDEATSALDEENERQVLDNLSTSGVAILLVTHRTHAELLAQRHFHLREGCLVEEFPRQSPKIERTSFSGEVC
jgi:ABC-type multidrug transport system fused ATPase/permease subunit